MCRRGLIRLCATNPWDAAFKRPMAGSRVSLAAWNMPHQVGPETAGDWTIQQMAYLSVDFLAYLIYLYIYIVFLAGYHGLVGNPQHDRRKVELMWFSIVEWKCTVLSFWGMLQWTIGFQRDSHSRTNLYRKARSCSDKPLSILFGDYYSFNFAVWRKLNKTYNA